LISFRYHLVSIVAVFLALAVGVVMGTTVVKQGVIENLQNRTNNLLEQTHTYQQQVIQLQLDLRGAKKLIQEVEPHLIQGQLAGQQIVMVTVQGVDPGEVDGVKRELEQAGASVLSVLVITARMALQDEGARADLAQMLQASPATPAADLSDIAARALGTRLADGSDPSATLDLLQQLVGGRYIDVRAGSGGLPQIGGVGQSIVVLTGGQSDPPVDPQTFLLPMLGAIVAVARPLVAAETTASAYEFVPLIRDDASLDHRMVTVDDADTVQGRVAVVLGLRDVIALPSSAGDYGTKSGASSLIPKP
jgi:hypothetical protein